MQVKQGHVSFTNSLIYGMMEASKASVSWLVWGIQAAALHWYRVLPFALPGHKSRE